MIDTFKILKIPYDKKFFNLPLSHYELLVEEIGKPKVIRHIKELLVYYKTNQIFSEKARVLLSKIQGKTLIESMHQNKQCECGFIFGNEEYPSCPLCNKPLYKGKGCFYKNEDGSCSQDGQDCNFKSQKECGK